MMLLSKLAPQSLRSLAGAPKIKIYPCHRNLATVFAVWSGATYAMTCFVKWSQKAKRFTRFGGWYNSIVVLMLVKSKCSNSKGAVTMMGCIGSLAWVPSCWMHQLQLLIAFCICVAIPGHQNHLCSKYRFTADPSVQHLGDIHSWQLLGEPWGLQTTKLLSTH